MRSKIMRAALAALAPLCVLVLPAVVRSQAPLRLPPTHLPGGGGFTAITRIPTGYVGIYGTNTADASGNVVANGTISFQPVSNSGTPISFRAAGGTGASATATFGVVIDAQTPGSGYSGSWSCTVTGGTYTSQATCTATVSSGGADLYISAPGAYTAAPTGLSVSGGTYAAGSARRRRALAHASKRSGERWRLWLWRHHRQLSWVHRRLELERYRLVWRCNRSERGRRRLGRLVS